MAGIIPAHGPLANAEDLVSQVSLAFLGWTSAVRESLELSQQESEESAIADACRVDSSSECSEVPDMDGEGGGVVALSPQSSDET